MYNSEKLTREVAGQSLNTQICRRLRITIKRSVTSIILENQEKAMKEDAAFFVKLHLLTLLVVVLIITTQF